MKPPRLIVTLTSTLVVLMSIGTTQSAQIAFTTPLRSVGNNFTMLSSDGSLIGGTNDVVFNWDGTLNDSVAGAVENATISSDQAFFAELWEVHDVMLYGAGNYTVYDDCPAGSPNCGAGNAVSFTVGTDQIGAHMLFDWPIGSPPGVTETWT